MIILPQAPNDFQKYLYIKQNKVVFYTWAIVSSIMLFTGMYFFIWVHPALALYSVFITFSLLYLSVSYLIGLKGDTFDLARHQDITARFKTQAEKFSVDIFLPICGEPFEVVKNTWEHVKQLQWPANLNIHVLDDGWNDQAKALAEEMGLNYIRRNDRPLLKKAGNVRNAFKQTNGDFIVIFDADFCPRPDFLYETLPYMAWEPKIAIVQTPQYFEVKKEQNWIEKGAGFVQELFYRLIQVSRNTWGASICVGSCAVYRRKALEPQGGTYPIEHSEDLHTGFSMIMQGFLVKYIPINCAMGVCPDTLQSFFIQQYRWCTGSTSLLTNPMFWKTKLSIMARLCYLSGMCYYAATASAIFLGTLPSMIMVWALPEKIVWFSLFFYGPSFLFGTLFMALWSKAPSTAIFDSLKIRQVSYYAHLYALKDRFFKTTVPWIPTGAVKNNIQRFCSFRNLLWFWLSFSTLWIVAGVFHHGLDYNLYPTLFFALFNYWINSTILKEQYL